MNSLLYYITKKLKFMTRYEILKYFSELKDDVGNMIFRPSNDTDTFEKGNGESETLPLPHLPADIQETAPLHGESLHFPSSS